MRQKTYTIVNDQGLQEVIEQLQAEVKRPENAALFVFDDSWNEIRLRGLLARLQDAVPGVPIAGISNYYRPDRHRLDREARTAISLLCFDEARCEPILVDLTEATERQASGMMVKRLRELSDAKAVMLLSTDLVVDVEGVMNRLNEAFPHIPVAGATAAIWDHPAEGPTSFVLCDGEVYRKAMLAVVFRGEDLCVRAGETFGWTPIGKRMKVTRMKDRLTVLEVDGRPASEIYTHYLGLTREQINADNVCEFPVFRWAGRHIAARIGLSAGEDGSVTFGAPLYNGDVLQFSYGNPNDILAWTLGNAGDLSPFGPQALFLISCMNRIIFLGAEQEKENEAFRRIQPSMALIHGNSELLRDGQGGGELNSALVFFALREGKLPEENDVEISIPEEAPVNEAGRVPFVKRLLTFLDVTTTELEVLEQNLSDEVARQTAQIRKQQQAINAFSREIVMTLSNAIDAKDSYTNGHSRRVAEYAREIARRYGYSPAEQEDVYMIGLLHDVGKIGVPDEIINKPGKLTDEEFAMIKRHPGIGAEILSSLTEYPDIASGAHWHHERWDGRGYPDGLAGEQIPEIARIISVADAYDAMTSTRSYRPVMEQARVRSEIEKGRGTQFSPEFADIMLQMIDDDPEYKMKGNTSKI